MHALLVTLWYTVVKSLTVEDMHWLLAVIIGHLLNALSFVLDKVLLTKSISNPFAFTFYVGVLGALVVVLIPFVDFFVPDAGALGVDIIAGVAFSVALLFFFLALQHAEASRIVPFIGGGVPVFTLVLELIFLDARFSPIQLVAFAVLVSGTVLIAIDRDQPVSARRLARRMWVHGLLAAVAFAVSFVITKYAFTTQPFYNSFIWMRLGSLLFPLLFLLWSAHRMAIWNAASMFRHRTGVWYVLAQGFGGAGFVFINYAISLASVSLVNALQGVQYLFLLVLVLIGSLFMPRLLKENIGRRSLTTKITGMVVISIGVLLISQNT